MITTTLWVLGPYARVVQRSYPIPDEGQGLLPNGQGGGFKHHVVKKQRELGRVPRWRVLRRAETWGRAADDLRRAKRAARIVFGRGFLG